MKQLYLFVCALLLSFCGNSQPLQQVPNPPSNEIYDLLVDSKGFLWIAHNLGISRYDGVSFTSFTNAEQSAISMTDLVEDNYGRIWCHNFNSQVFYIEHDKMYCLKEYNFRNESVFPRMALLGDELVITSNTGLFFCNTKTFKCRYVISPGLPYYKNKYGGLGVTEVCAIGDKILAYIGLRTFNWATSGPDGNLHVLKAPAFAWAPDIKRFLKLEPESCGDTAFIMDNVEGLLYGVVVRNDSMVPVLRKKINAHVNTISVVNKKVWVNTSNGSFALNGNDTIFNYNISAVAEGKDSLRWFGSLNTGLLLSAQNTGWNIVQPGLLPEGDYIACTAKYGDELLLCSSRGSIFMLNKTTGNFSKVANMPLVKGPPANMQPIYGSNFLIEAAKGMFIFDAATTTVRMADSFNASREVLFSQNIAYLTYAAGLSILDIRKWGLNFTNPIDVSSFSDSLFWQISFNGARSSRKQSRCRALAYDSASNTIIAAFSDGLFRIAQNKLIPVLYNNQPLYISSLVNYGSKVYAGSFNNGLFVIKHNTVTKIVTDVELSRDAIVKLKQANNHVWVFGTQNIALLDAAADTFIKNMYPLPVNATSVADINEDESNVYLATSGGIFKQPLNQKYKIAKTTPYLLYTIVNNADTFFANNLILASNKNSLLLRLAVPVFTNAERVHFKYRLYNDGTKADESVWYYTHNVQRDIEFIALKPGSYTLEILALQDNYMISTTPLVYNFTISRPWYNTWPFYIFVALIIISITIAIQQYRLRQILKVERVRRKIASDLHDDIGSTLSSINVYSEIAKRENDNKDYINTIQQNAVSIINNLDDLVWNINPKNDVLDNMIVRMRQFAEPLMAEKDIECTFNIVTDNLQASITPDVRTNIYLLFKEAVNNVIKHSGSTACTINILQKGKSLTLTVADNGRGFDAKLISKHRNGLHNMQQRAADIKGNLNINSAPAQGTVVTITSQLN